MGACRRPASCVEARLDKLHDAATSSLGFVLGDIAVNYSPQPARFGRKIKPGFSVAGLVLCICICTDTRLPTAC